MLGKFVASFSFGRASSWCTVLMCNNNFGIICKIFSRLFKRGDDDTCSLFPVPCHCDLLVVHTRSLTHSNVKTVDEPRPVIEDKLIRLMGKVTIFNEIVWYRFAIVLGACIRSDTSKSRGGLMTKNRWGVPGFFNPSKVE